MAEFPQARRMRRTRDQEEFLSRWSFFAIALFLTALFGLLSGIARDVQFPRGIQASEKGSETPHLSKRDPMRALASADRKDSTGTHATNDGGTIIPHFVGIDFPRRVLAASSAISSSRPVSGFWPGPLPRAPPLQA